MVLFLPMLSLLAWRCFESVTDSSEERKATWSLDAEKLATMAVSTDCEMAEPPT